MERGGGGSKAAGRVELASPTSTLHHGCCCCFCRSLEVLGGAGALNWSCWNASAKIDNSSSMDSPGQLVESTSEAAQMAPPEQNMEERYMSRDDDGVLRLRGKCNQLRNFSYSDLKVATRNFRPDSLLGEGGFGCVFKGWVDERGTAPVKPGTGLTVAVKILNRNSLQGHSEWLAEVYFLGLLHHPNLVKLVGFCMEEDQRLLVYEFMQRGSLENHLFRRGALPLSWETRMKVALGAAEGLAFLHGQGKAGVIYRDFKTSNILLDVDYNAKLSDFGLAKDGPDGDKSHVSTRVMGTYGYAAPEYVMTGHLTARSDVYSFGVVLLEIVSGRKCMDKSRPSGEHNLVEWAKPYLMSEKKSTSRYRLVDPGLAHFSEKGAYKAASLAFRCLSRDPRVRPLMPQVVHTLVLLQNMKDTIPNPFYQHHLRNSGSSKSFHS